MQHNDSTVLLDTVPYAASGRWAINLWMKPGPLYGDNFQYLFSHAQQKFFTTGWESNQASCRLTGRSLCMSVLQYNGLWSVPIMEVLSASWEKHFISMCLGPVQSASGTRSFIHVGHMQIRLFYPELDHPAFGVIRAIAKDNTDTETGPSASVFLDSDNLVRCYDMQQDNCSLQAHLPHETQETCPAISLYVHPAAAC